MIHFQHISKSFGANQVLQDVSGTFYPSKVNLVAGCSGTGKSVLVKCIVGLILPDKGRAYFDDVETTTHRGVVNSGVRRDLGMLFQGGALFDSKNVEDNVRFPLDVLTTMTPREKRMRARDCLHRVGLGEEVYTKMPAELSGGMRKRVGIARAIVNSPKYLFCDEPNSGLDPQTALRIDELIQEITYEYGMTTVVVTHDMNSLVTMGDHILFLSGGQVAWQGSAEDVFSADADVFNEFFFASKLARMLRAGGKVKVQR